MKILTLNCGSSSVKYSLYDWEAQQPLAGGVVERVAIGGSAAKHEVPGRDMVTIKRECPDHTAAIALVMEILTDSEYGVIGDMDVVSAVGHRCVHGGENFVKSAVVDEEVIRTLKEVANLAPLHNPPNIRGIEAAREVMPNVPHIAVFDTAFHQTIPPEAYIYALPYDWYTDFGIRRYGFHGTSHLYVSRRAAVMLGKRPDEVNIITCHIGNGASVAAIEKGAAVDTSMGLTPLEGVVMGTRCGDIDPAIPVYCQQSLGMDIDTVYKVMNRLSGVLGVSGKYVDRRDIEENMGEPGEELPRDDLPGSEYRCKLAFDVEAYHLLKYIGAYAAVLGGVNAIVFTAGVGENAPLLRERICRKLGYMGVAIDDEKNHNLERGVGGDISAPDSPVKVFIIPTDEERVFVEDVVAILSGTYDIPAKFTYAFECIDYGE
ncbi:MAG: acetate kinase [bacterium]|nr:acetate kinase [bacterium]